MPLFFRVVMYQPVGLRKFQTASSIEVIFNPSLETLESIQL